MDENHSAHTEREESADRKLMAGQPTSWLGRVAVGLTTVLMFAAVVLMFVV